MVFRKLRIVNSWGGAWPARPTAPRWKALVCTTIRRILASASENQGPAKGYWTPLCGLVGVNHVEQGAMAGHFTAIILLAPHDFSEFFLGII